MLGKPPFIRFRPYFFFTVAPDVTRFGQEIGSIMMVAGVIVVIADLQQKTAGPKIELLQTVKKGGEERRGEEGGHSIISRSGMDGVAAVAADHCHDKKVSYESERFEWGVTQAEHIDATR